MGRADHLLLLDCRSRATELVPMADPSVELLIANTNVRHELGSSQYAKRRAQCEAAAKILRVPSLRDAAIEDLNRAKSIIDDVVFRRARHVITEIERAVEAAARFRASEWQKAGELMYASHRSLRDDYEVSCAELDALVESAESIGVRGGVFGCRMTGGGFGGCAVALVKSDNATAISNQLAFQYKKKTGLDATIFGSRPAAGASIIQTAREH
jgi:galactokinase